MTDTHVDENQQIPSPACKTCGTATRIVGIEPHARFAHTDVQTYVCDECDQTQILVVPLPSLKLV